MHLFTPVLGDEQVFDVELDRNTVFLPFREDQRVVSWDQTYDPSSPSELGSVGSVVGPGGQKTGREDRSDESHYRALDKNMGMKGGDDGNDDLTRGQ